MPEHFRALIVVMGLAIPILYMAKAPLCSIAYDEAMFLRHRAMWIAVTLIAFLSHSFWISTIVCALILHSAAAKDRAPLALYCAVMFAYPHFDHVLPGFGPIEHFFQINHVRTLNLVLLLPFGYALYRDKANTKHLSGVADFALLGFLTVVFVAGLKDASIVGGIRNLFYLFVDVWLPYYVASRGIRSLADFRLIAAGFLLAATILSAIAVFESARHWLLYESLRGPLGLPPSLPRYLLRIEGGPLRANVSVGGAIILGYVIMVGLGMYAMLSGRLLPHWKGVVAFFLIVGGLGATVSRGPWIGAMALLAVMTALGPGRGKRFASIIGAGLITTILLAASPFGRRIINYMPFVGTVDPGSVDYRTRLFHASMETFWQNPVFGDTNYLQNPVMEQMRQGQGIIDVVNTYLQIALPYGAVGLLLFLAALLAPTYGAWKARKIALMAGEDEERVGRALLAIMAGILITIGTVSSIGVIPTIYWLIAGFCVSYTRVVGATRQGVPRSQTKASIEQPRHKGTPGRRQRARGRVLP